MSELPVLTAVTGAWEATLVAGLERTATGVHVVRRCVDLSEVLSATAAGLARAVVLSADLQRLDRDAVAHLLAAGVAVVGLVDPGDAVAGRRLRNLGVLRVLPADSPADEVAAAVTAAVEELTERRAAPAALDVRTGDPGSAVPPHPAVTTGELPTVGGMGRIVAVWGPTGAPGRTTIAVTLAAELAKAGATVLLVDGDTYGASVAQTLGLLDESAGLAAAARAANHGGLDAARLAGLALTVAPGLHVLTGLPQPRRWAELRAAALETVWQEARRVADWVIVDCGFSLEADEEVSFDTAAPRRNAATLSAVQAADIVLAVGAADPVGLHRLVRGLPDLAETIPAGQPIRVVVNRVRSSAVGARPEQRVREALARYAGVPDAILVPDDRAACDAAMLGGRSLTEQAPKSPARAAVAALAGELSAAFAAEPSQAAAASRDRRRRRRRADRHLR